MIDAEELLKLITKEDIVKILTELGSDAPKPDKDDNLYFTTVCHHGDSKKLHYFSDSGFFCCYTSCGSMSLYNVLMSANGWSFTEAFRFVADYKGINLYKRRVGLGRKEYKNEDMEFLNKHLETPRENKNIVLPGYDEKVLRLFDDYMPDIWEREGISEKVAQRYRVKFLFNQYAAIIPHFSENGNLIGIRKRSFKYDDLQSGRKYIPLTIQNFTYKYPVGFNLYGLYENGENIRSCKRINIFEGEKSIWKYESMFGRENNCSVALLGTNLSLWQKNKILEYGVEELTLCLDKQYKVEALDDENKNAEEYKEFVRYIKSLIKIAKMFVNYCSVYVVLCWDKRIGYKDSPLDQGKQIFNELFAERYLANIEEMEELIS